MKRHLSFMAALGMWFFASITAAHAQVRADTGGIAIGGSVTGSTVIIGIPQEKVDELVRDAKRPLEELTTQQKENIALLKEKLVRSSRPSVESIKGRTPRPHGGPVGSAPPRPQPPGSDRPGAHLDFNLRRYARTER
jgi:hypothetical protein